MRRHKFGRGVRSGTKPMHDRRGGGRMSGRWGIRRSERKEAAREGNREDVRVVRRNAGWIGIGSVGRLYEYGLNAALGGVSRSRRKRRHRCS